MLFRAITFLSALLLPSLIFAQANKMSDPDVLGLKLGMNKNEALAIIKKNFPNSKINIVNKDIMLGTAYLTYDAQYKITLDKNKIKANTSSDELEISILPNDQIIGIRRVLSYKPGKQQTADLYNALKEKYDDMVYYVYDDSTKFADQAMWSDRMKSGLSLVGTQYAQVGQTSMSDFGTVMPYPYCWSEMSHYSGDFFDPSAFYSQLNARNSLATAKAKQWAMCGKALWIANSHEKPLYFNTVKTEMILVDLATAAQKINALPEMLKNNPKTVYAKPATEIAKPSAGTPNF